MGKIKQGVSLHDSFIISTGFGLKNGVLTSKRRGLPQKSMVRDSKMHGWWAPYDSPFTAYKLSRFAYS
jgi:hypothetical protein